jgi:hypothetical protein
MNSVKILLSIAAANDLEIHQMDVRTAFMIPELKEDLYLKPPKGFIQKGKIWKLNKTIYGLRMPFYIANHTRPDLCQSVGVLSSYVTNPDDAHWTALKKVMRYCKGTLDHGIILGGNNSIPVLVGYSDSDWAGCLQSYSQFHSILVPCLPDLRPLCRIAF